MMGVAAEAPALLIDYGGVLTASIYEGFTKACTELGVEPAGFIAECFTSDPTSPVARLETGEVELAEFCDLLTPVLSRFAAATVRGRDWLDSIQVLVTEVDQAMVDEVNRLLDQGVTTVLVSNAWGPAEIYPWDRLPTFSHALVSTVVKLRKPDPAIYHLAAATAGRPAEECLFIDDVESNLVPARELGMRTILHRSADATIAELGRVYG